MHSNAKRTGRGAALHAPASGATSKVRSRSLIVSQHDHNVPVRPQAFAAKTPSRHGSLGAKQAAAAAADLRAVIQPTPVFPNTSRVGRLRQSYEHVQTQQPQQQRQLKAAPPPEWRRTLQPAGRSFQPAPLQHLRRASSGGESAALRGFGNFGNTCYMNSVLVCLMALPPFLRCLLCDSTQQTLQDAAHVKAPLTAEMSKLLLQQLAQQVQASRAASASAPVPQRAELVKATLAAACNRFQGYQQQDAHEFLIHLLAQLDTELSALGRRMGGIAALLRVACMPSQPQVGTQHALLHGKAAEGGATYPLSVPGAHMPEDRRSRAAMRAAVNPIRRCFVFETYSSMTCACCGYSRGHASEHVCLSLTLAGSPVQSPEATAPSDAAALPSTPVVTAPSAHTGEESLVLDSDSDGDACIAGPYSTAGHLNTSLSAFDDVSTPQAHPAAPVPPAAAATANDSSGDMLPLTALLDAHFAAERLELRCDECKEGSHVLASSAIASLPRVLILQLNRFTSDPYTGATRKVQTPVPFPVQLSLTEHCFKGTPPGTELTPPALAKLHPNQQASPVVVMAPPPLDVHDNVLHAIGQRVRRAGAGAQPAGGTASGPKPIVAGVGGGIFTEPRQRERISPALHAGSYHSGTSMDTVRAHVAGSAPATQVQGGAAASTTPDTRGAFKSIVSSEDSTAGGVSSVQQREASTPAPGSVGQLWGMVAEGTPSDSHSSARISSLPARGNSGVKDIIHRKRARGEAERQAEQQHSKQARGWSQAQTGLHLDADLQDDTPVQNLGGAFKRASKQARQGGLKGGEGGNAVIDLSEQSGLDLPADVSSAALDGADDTGGGSPSASSDASSEEKGGGDDDPPPDCVRGVPLVGANPLYELQAVVCHLGTGDAQGHYTCLARGLRNGRMQWGAGEWEEMIGWGHVPGSEAGLAQPPLDATKGEERKDNANMGSGGEQWWLYNDSSVRRAGLEEVQSEEAMRSAYILAYVLKDPYN